MHSDDVTIQLRRKAGNEGIGRRSCVIVKTVVSCDRWISLPFAQACAK